MAKIQPFRGCYYNTIANLSDVVVSPDNFQANDSQHPYAYYQLDFSQEHQRVRERLAEWFQKGLLVQDHTPAFYIDIQHFFYQGEAHTRQDLFLSLDILETDILSHEHTLPPVVQERYRLLESTQTHLSPLFLMYSDPMQVLQKQLEEAIKTQRPLLALAHQGITHQVYRLSDPQLHTQLQRYLEDHPFYIADGHHRYAAALEYARQNPEHKESRYVLAYATPMEAPGLMVLPYHRYVSKGFQFPPWPTYLAALATHFNLHTLPDAQQSTIEKALQRPETCWVMQKEDKAWLIREPGFQAGEANETRRLQPDNTLALDTLHHHILETLAGFPKAGTRQGTCLKFSTDMAALQYDLLTRGGVAFFVQPTPLSQLCARAEAHQMMPPKSTYFYPKVPSGILFNRFSTAV